jgi:hypothetical protein
MLPRRPIGRPATVLAVQNLIDRRGERAPEDQLWWCILPPSAADQDQGRDGMKKEIGETFGISNPTPQGFSPCRHLKKIRQD